jgi:Uma2 family endonuclease
MEANRSRMRWTYAEFARLPSDGRRRELIAGELHVTPAPHPLHQRIVARLVTRLEPFVAGHALGWVFPGPIDVLFAEGDYVEPDVAFVRRDHGAIITHRGIEGPPDLIVEVLSPSTAERDRKVKRDRYAHFGVPEYWIVDPDGRSVEVHRFPPEAESPRVMRDLLAWRPVPEGPTLVLRVAEISFPDDP